MCTGNNEKKKKDLILILKMLATSEKESYTHVYIERNDSRKNKYLMSKTSRAYLGGVKLFHCTSIFQ